MKSYEYDLTPKYDKAKSFYGKARVVETETESYLISYKSKVCSIIKTTPDDFKVKIYNVDNVFSKTSLRHIKEFLKQMGLKAESKDQIQNDYEIVEV